MESSVKTIKAVTAKAKVCGDITCWRFLTHSRKWRKSGRMNRIELWHNVFDNRYYDYDGNMLPADVQSKAVIEADIDYYTAKLDDEMSNPLTKEKEVWRIWERPYIGTMIQWIPEEVWIDILRLFEENIFNYDYWIDEAKLDKAKLDEAWPV